MHLPHRVRDLAGFKSGRLVAVSFAGYCPLGKTRWLCQCECGAMPTVGSAQIIKGTTKSCGCWKREMSPHRKPNLQHGHARTPEGKASRTYKSWLAMRGRCHRASAVDFHRYGGRGITVCSRWDAFENFLADMGERPAGKTIDRIDNAGNYEPGNCRWATPKEQSANRRTGHEERVTRNRKSTKLSTNDVFEIKRLLQDGSSHSDIARDFGVSRSHVSGINSGRSWSTAK